MSTQTFQLIVVIIFLAPLAALIWALSPRGGRRGVLIANMPLSAGVLYLLWPYLLPESAEVRSLSQTDILVSVTKLVVLVSALLAIGGLRVPAALIWSGLAANLLPSLPSLGFERPP